MEITNNVTDIKPYLYYNYITLFYIVAQPIHEVALAEAHTHSRIAEMEYTCKKRNKKRLLEKKHRAQYDKMLEQM